MGGGDAGTMDEDAVAVLERKATGQEALMQAVKAREGEKRMSYPIPNRKRESTFGAGQVVSYQLTDVELAYLRAGRLDMIPTATERGIEIPASVPRPAPEKQMPEPEPEPEVGKPERRDRRWKHNIPEPELRRLREAGLTIAQIAETLNMHPSTARWWLKHYDISTARRRWK